MLKEKAFSYHIDLSFSCDLPDTVFLDAKKVKQIIYNLLSNAIKFTPEKGKVNLQAQVVDKQVLLENVNVAPARVVFDQYLEIIVSDTGIGISNDDLKKLFQPFIQVDNALTRKYEGTGLGLVMIKQLTELHGGYLTVDSVPKQGSTFTVWLPYRKALESDP
jgi:signal transduction histidine kinase